MQRQLFEQARANRNNIAYEDYDEYQEEVKDEEEGFCDINEGYTFTD